MDDDDDFGGDLSDGDLMLAYEAASANNFATPATDSASSHSSLPQKNTAIIRQAVPALPSHNSHRTRPLEQQNSFQQNRGAQNQQRRTTLEAQVEEELQDLPSDAFDSSLSTSLGPRTQSQRALLASCRQPLRLSGQQSYRQTNLFGEAVNEDAPQQPTSSRVYRRDQPPERPTHHKLDDEALKTWVYPTNLGAIRDYQFSIVKNGLFHNTLVALPTGLGKTFIAATVILNFYRWTKDAKMIFVAPTKPLVTQQVEACLTIAGIPRSETTLLTGETAPALRAREWSSKRLFFMTPQTLQNDLSKGYADPKSIALLVIDEAHRATGDYAYVKVIGFIRRFSKSFRVLALTATPGSTVEGVQEVIDNLGVSHVEIRTEESIDIRQYIHGRETEKFVLDPSLEIKYVQEHLSKAIKPFCEKLDQQRIWYGRDPMAITTFGLLKTRNEWVNGPGRHVNQPTKYMIMAVFSVLQSLAHSIKLLNYHGLKPFYDSMSEFRKTVEEQNERGSKYKRQLVKDPEFQEAMMLIERWLGEDSFESHPKIGFLKERLNTHFKDNPGTNTKAIVFSEYRDSAEEIVRTLNRCGPNIKASIFVGQADSKRSAGMKQKQQIEAIEKFKNGVFNVLVATSIGEEGLDIGQVDLIICYDASSSPIRMLQRMGRTGRKRAGRAILLLMRGKEEDKFTEAQETYTHMQQLICDGAQFNFRFDLSERIVPRDAKPVVDKRFIEIPIENTQNMALPEPSKSGARPKKAPKKKFHMPDNVQTGFIKASSSLGGQTRLPNWKEAEGPAETDFLADLVSLDEIKANSTLNGGFMTGLPFGLGSPEAKTVDPTQAEFLRQLGATSNLCHGRYTKQNIQLMERIAGQGYSPPAGPSKDVLRISVPAFARDPNDPKESESDEPTGFTSASRLPKRRKIAVSPPLLKRAAPRVPARRKAVHEEDDAEDDDEEQDSRWSKKKSYKPAAKGMTKQRSAQFQSYSFGGATSRPTPKPVARRPAQVARARQEEQEEEEQEEQNETDGEEILSEVMNEDDETDEGAEPENDDSLLPRMPTRGRGSRGGRGGRASRGGRGSRGGARGSTRGRGRGAYSSYPRLEERGDDCTRTSDNYESDGSDSGGDLVDFINDDEEDEGATSSSMPEDDYRDGSSVNRRHEAKKRSMKTFTSSPATSSPPRRRNKAIDLDDDSDDTHGKNHDTSRNSKSEGAFYVPMRLTQTLLDSDDGDDDVVNVFADRTGGAVGKKKTAPTATAEKAKPKKSHSGFLNDDDDDDDDDDSDDGVFARRPSQKRSRRLIYDSDSDE